MGLAKEFKEFVMRGNVMDLAIGVIIGGAFGKITASLVDNILMPLVGIVLQGVNFKDLKFTFGSAVLKYGEFISSIVDFVLIAFVLFLIIKGMNSMKKKEAAVPAAPAAPSTEEKLLMEIRDLLRK